MDAAVPLADAHASPPLGGGRHPLAPWLVPPTTSLLGRLGDAFARPVRPQALPDPYWIAGSEPLARHLGLPAAWLGSPQATRFLAGEWPDTVAAPLASVYSGHQFGVWAGQLGDGRALLVGSAPNGDEVQLKGSGLTPYSRMGDGRAVLRSSLREFLASEAMAALGIPTTRALGLVGSAAPVYRETVETAAVVARTAPSFVRFGHFEHFAAAGDTDRLRGLADAVIDTGFTSTDDANTRAAFDAGGPARYAALLRVVAERTADLLAAWQAVGFCHGVMNTDNMSILGLTIDYGPYQFLDAYDPGHICNHSDSQGRYAYARQPNIAYWNLFCLGQALLPLIEDQETAVAALEVYKRRFPAQLQQRLAAKLGLLEARDDDRVLIQDLLGVLAAQRVDHTIFWRRLSQDVAGAGPGGARDLFVDRAAFDVWMLRYSERTIKQNRRQQAELMLKTNPAVVLRNHLLELAIRAAARHDFAPLLRLLEAARDPVADRAGDDDLRDFPPDWAQSLSISCSS